MEDDRPTGEVIITCSTAVLERQAPLSETPYEFQSRRIEYGICFEIY